MKKVSVFPSPRFKLLVGLAWYGTWVLLGVGFVRFAIFIFQ